MTHTAVAVWHAGGLAGGTWFGVPHTHSHTHTHPSHTHTRRYHTSSAPSHAADTTFPVAGDTTSAVN